MLYAPAKPLSTASALMLGGGLIAFYLFAGRLGIPLRPMSRLEAGVCLLLLPLVTWLHTAPAQRLLAATPDARYFQRRAFLPNQAQLAFGASRLVLWAMAVLYFSGIHHPAVWLGLLVLFDVLMTRYSPLWSTLKKHIDIRTFKDRSASAIMGYYGLLAALLIAFTVASTQPAMLRWLPTGEQLTTGLMILAVLPFPLLFLADHLSDLRQLGRHTAP